MTEEDEILLEETFGERRLSHVTVQELLDELQKVRDKQKHVLINRVDYIRDTHESWAVYRIVDRAGYFDIGLGDPNSNFDTSPEHRERKRIILARRAADAAAAKQENHEK